MPSFPNPFRPGAGHAPPHLAGRQAERQEFMRLLRQERILENLVLTGLRGVGKTVLLDSFKPYAVEAGWAWVGTDLSETTSVNETNLAIRLITDLAIVTSDLPVGDQEILPLGFGSKPIKITSTLSHNALTQIYDETPGLPADKLKTVLTIAWTALATTGAFKGLIFAYDEAQNLADQAAKEQYPLSLLLDVFQSIQKTGYPLMLVLTGLPTLFPKLVEARTFTERMFRVVFLDSLTEPESRDAIVKPVEAAGCPVRLSDQSVDTISSMSAGYPYFIQFICREVYDAFLFKFDRGETASVPVEEIMQKLDADFFAGRWARATDRQRELLRVVASLEEKQEPEFTIQGITTLSKELLEKPFGTSHVNQILATLSNNGLIFKNRHGKYSFAVPLMGSYILRQGI